MIEQNQREFTAADGRKFAFPVGIAFLLLAGLTWWRGHVPISIGFAAAAGVLIVGGVVVPSRLGPVYRAWMGMALLISKVTTPIFLGIVFYGVITPTALIMRALGKNPIDRSSEDGSFWVSREPGATVPDSMRRQF